MIPFIFLFLIFSIHHCNSLDYGTPFDCTNGVPNINQQETVVRCALIDLTDNVGQYRGLDLFIETRHINTGRYLWFADVKFHSSSKTPKTTGCTTSNVTIEYSSALGFFQPAAPFVRQPPIRLLHVDHNTEDPNTGECRNLYEYYINRSIIEFKLENPLNLNDLNKHIKDMQEQRRGWLSNWTEFPKYTILGYAHKEKAWNCAVFSAALLQKLNVNLCGSSNILRNFIRCEYGNIKESLGIGVVLGGAIGAAIGGPIGAGIGAGAGGLVFGGGKAAHDVYYDRAYPWVIVDEIIKNHHRLNIKPSFLIPNGHVINDNIGILRRSLIENNQNKYNEWYNLFVGGDLNAFVVMYNL